MASGGPEDTAQAVLRQAVGTLLDNFNFSSTSNESVDLLTDLARRFMADCWKKGKTYAEHAGRTKLVPNDMNHAFTRMRFSVAELHDYVQQNGSVPALKPVTAFPVNKTLSRGVFAPTPSEQELEVRPEYIPSHYPATHPEWTNENADFLTMFKSGGAEKKQIADFPDFFSCSAQNLGLFQSKNRDPPEVVESEHVADHASLTGIMSSANIAAVRQEKAEAEKPPKIPKKKGRPRKLVEFAPREMTSSQPLLQPLTFHPNALGEGTSSGTSSPLPPQLEVACAIKEKIKNKTKANKVDSPMPSLENCQNREDGEESNQSTSTDISSVPPVANSPIINQSTHPSLVPPLKRKYTKRHDKPLKVPKLAKKSNTGGGSLPGLKLPSMSKSFLEAQKKQLQMFEQEKLRKEARQAATQAAEAQRRQQATEIQKAQKAALDMTIASMLIGVNAVNQNLLPSIDNNNAAVAALMLHNLLAANAQQQKKDTLHPLLNNLSNDASASASTSVQQSPAQHKNQAKSNLATQNQQQPKLKLVFSKSNSNLAETSVRSVTEEEKTIPFAEEKIAEADQPSTSTANHLSSNNAVAATSVFGAQQVPDDSDSDTVPFVGGTALSPSEKSALVTTFPADLNESMPKLETPKKNDKPKKMNEEETPPMLNSVKNVDKERTKDKKKKRKKDKKKDSKDSSEKDRDHHHRSHKKKKKKKKHKRERDRSSDKTDRSKEKEKEKRKEIETKPGKEKERKDDKKKNDSRPGTSQSIVLQISNKHSENPTSKKKESSSNYSPPEKIPKLELNDKGRESPKEPKLVVPLKIKLGSGIKSEKPVEVAQKEPETLKVVEKKEERIVPKLKLLTGFGIPAQVVTSVSNSNEKKSEKSSKSEPTIVIEKKQPVVEFSKDPTPPPVLVKEKRRPGRPPGKSEKKLKADKEDDLKKEAKKKKSEFENDILKYVDGAELRRTSSSFEHDEKSSGEEEAEKEQIWICPACSIAYTEGANMVGCDSCDDWFHWHCVGLLVEPPENIPWYCPKCAKSKKAVKRPVSGSGKRPSELSTERKKSQVI